MIGVDSKVDRAVQLLVWPDVSEGLSLGEGLPGPDFQFNHGHGLPLALDSYLIQPSPQQSLQHIV